MRTNHALNSATEALRPALEAVNARDDARISQMFCPRLYKCVTNGLLELDRVGVGLEIELMKVSDIMGVDCWTQIGSEKSLKQPEYGLFEMGTLSWVYPRFRTDRSSRPVMLGGAEDYNGVVGGVEQPDPSVIGKLAKNRQADADDTKREHLALKDSYQCEIDVLIKCEAKLTYTDKKTTTEFQTNRFDGFFPVRFSTPYFDPPTEIRRKAGNHFAWSWCISSIGFAYAKRSNTAL